MKIWLQWRCYLNVIRIVFKNSAVVAVQITQVPIQCYYFCYFKVPRERVQCYKCCYLNAITDVIQ